MTALDTLQPLQRAALRDAGRGVLGRCRGGYRLNPDGAVFSKRPIGALVRAGLADWTNDFESGVRITAEGKRTLAHADENPAGAGNTQPNDPPRTSP